MFHHRFLFGRILGPFAAVVLLAGWHSDGRARGQDAASGPERGAAQGRVDLVETQLQETERSVKALDERLTPLEQETRELIDRLAALQPPETTPAKPKEKAPLQVDFRPPLAFVSKKPSTLSLAFEDGRVTVVDIPPISKQLNAQLNSVILPQARAGTATQWKGTWPVPGSPYDIHYDLKVQGNSVVGRAGIVRKPGTRGETVDELLAADSAVGQALQGANPMTTVLNCAVYPDSFEAYRLVRKLAWDRGFEVAWIPFSAGEPIGIGAGGVTPN